VSHDLRTPLAAILGSADSLLDPYSRLDPENRRSLLENIRDEAERLNRLLRNLLEMTRLSAGALKVEKTPQPLEEPLGSALARLGKRLEDRKVEVRIPEDFPMVPMDGILIEQALFNLFENALKYTPARTPLEVTAARDETTAFVEVMDRGPGLAPGEEEIVFEKFHRGRDAAGGGTGLGLAVARGILEAHAGKLTAFNRQGGGAVFRLELPLGPAEPKEQQP
jgi:two-component system sensor histidine kinase KdpD